MTDPLALAATVLSLVLLLAAALHDAAARTIPNWIPAGLAVFGVILRIRQGDALAGLAIAALLLTILGALWLRGFLGGGDTKLIPAVALVLPPAATPGFVLSVAIAGGGLALIYLALSFVVRRPRPGPRRGLPARLLKAEAWRMHRRGPLPYALAIAAGAFPIVVNTLAR